MKYATRFYNVRSSIFFNTMQELRYKDVVRNFFLKVLVDDQTPQDPFAIRDALINLGSFLDDPEMFEYKVTGPQTVEVFRAFEKKSIIIVTINSDIVDKAAT